MNSPPQAANHNYVYKIVQDLRNHGRNKNKIREAAHALQKKIRSNLDPQATGPNGECRRVI